MQATALIYVLTMSLIPKLNFLTLYLFSTLLRIFIKMAEFKNDTNPDMYICSYLDYYLLGFHHKYSKYVDKSNINNC